MSHPHPPPTRPVFEFEAEGRRFIPEPLCNPLQPQAPDTLSPPDLPAAAEEQPPAPAADATLDAGQEYLASVLMQALHILVGGDFEDRPRVLAAVKAALVLQRRQGASMDAQAWAGVWEAAQALPIDTQHGPFGEIVDTRF